MNEENKLHFNAWAALYFVMALFWCFMAYTELTGKWLTVPEQEKEVEAQRVPVEQPEEAIVNGKSD